MKEFTQNTQASRRTFLKSASCAVAATALGGHGWSAEPEKTGGGTPEISEILQKRLPRWRGFNLTYFFSRGDSCNPLEEDFQWIADWGFDFVRIPMTYTHWIEGDDVYKIREETLKKVDRIVEWGRQYKIHVSLNFHRAPGYSVNRERQEPFNLWKDEAALKAFLFHWQMFAERYKGIPAERLSFDLVNEPCGEGEGGMTREAYVRVVREAFRAIHEKDPGRYVILDGMDYARKPLPELADLDIGQSCRGYDPMEISHYQASWVESSKYFPEPRWPMKDWNRERLEKHYVPWVELAQKGVGVHCGECGCHNKTPHAVFLAWFRDVLDILKSHNIGYALWNFQGSFGLLDSQRADVAYEDWKGRKLDRKLLELMREF